MQPTQPQSYGSTNPSLPELQASRDSWGPQNPAAEDLGQEALRRLSRLPPELQDAVLRYLPLADILIWQKVSRAFCDRVKVSALRERAFCRAFGSAFPRAALTRDNYEHSLRPWLAGFSANTLGPDWPGRVFCPEVLWCAISRTLQMTPHLVLKEVGAFQLAGVSVRGVYFSPTGNHLVVSMDDRAFDPVDVATSVFTWNGENWRQGAPFLEGREAKAVCFSDNGQRVAVADITDVRIWEMGKVTDWKKTARLVPARPFFHRELCMLFSPDGRSLSIQTSDYNQYVWDLDEQQQWQLGGHFVTTSEYWGNIPQKTVFSPDGRWLLVHSADERDFVLFSKDTQRHWTRHSALDLGLGLTACSARFRPGGQQVFIRAREDVFSVWQLHDGVWSEQQRFEHHGRGRSDFFFSPDGQQLVAEARSGLLLWTQDAENRWIVRDIIHVDQRNYFGMYDVRFDPAGRWFMAEELYRFRGRLSAMLVRDSKGQWTSAPEANDSLKSLQRRRPSKDGQHLVALYRPEEGNGDPPHELRLLGFRGTGAWVTKARTNIPFDSFIKTSMDPFCCHLAICCEDGKVRLLRTQEAPSPPCQDACRLF